MKHLVNKIATTTALAAALLSGCSKNMKTHPPEIPSPENVSSECKELNSLPKPVADLIYRKSMCQHYGGEHTGGADKERDAWVNGQMSKLSCDRLEEDSHTLAGKFASTPSIAQRILDKREKLIESAGTCRE